MSSSKSHGKSISGTDFPGTNSVQKGVSLPILQSTDVLVVSFLTSLSPVGWIAGGLFPNTIKSKEKESSLFSSINQLSINEWIYRRSQVLLEILCCKRTQKCFL